MAFENFYFVEKEGASYSFSSTQANLPEDIANKVMSFGKSIPDADIHTDPIDTSYGREDNIHTTVLYGIHGNDVAEVERVLADVKPFYVTLGPISFFESDAYKVMKIEVKSKELHNLNAKLKDNIEFTSSFPDYNPHVTIAYVKKDYDESGLDHSKFFGEMVYIDSIVFSPKEGDKITIPLK